MLVESINRQMAKPRMRHMPALRARKSRGNIEKEADIIIIILRQYCDMRWRVKQSCPYFVKRWLAAERGGDVMCEG